MTVPGKLITESPQGYGNSEPNQAERTSLGCRMGKFRRCLPLGCWGIPFIGPRFDPEFVSGQHCDNTLYPAAKSQIIMTRF
jgi:hypothetical protein